VYGLGLARKLEPDGKPPVNEQPLGTISLDNAILAGSAGGPVPDPRRGTSERAVPLSSGPGSTPMPDPRRGTSVRSAPIASWTNP
jgi:hypothetical protein